jgi:hypothetical protein
MIAIKRIVRIQTDNMIGKNVIAVPPASFLHSERLFGMSRYPQVVYG